MHDLEIDLKEYYEKKAKELDEIALTYHNPILYKQFFFKARFKKVLSTLNVKKRDYILELGCGSGYYTKAMVKKGAKIFATDFSSNYVKQTKKYVGNKKDVKYKTADATKLPFKKNTFDKVLFTEVIEHIPNYEDSLHEIRRVLKSGGVLTISTPSKYSPMNIAYGLKRKIKGYKFNEHVHEFTPAELKKLLEKYFIVESFEFSNFLLPYPIDNLFLRYNSKKIIMIIEKIENIMQNTPIIKNIGWTMIVSARKK